MVRFIPFAVSHLNYVNVQPQQAAELAAMSGASASALTECGVAMTAVAEGDASRGVLACAGIIHRWRGLANLWSIVGRDTKPREWPTIVRRVCAGLDTAHRAGVVRIEATADAGFLPAQRLLELLGFDEPRALLRAYSPQGRDCWLYARIRHLESGAAEQEIAA